jgi:hypothetical protein
MGTRASNESIASISRVRDIVLFPNERVVLQAVFQCGSAVLCVFDKMLVTCQWELTG